MARPATKGFQKPVRTQDRKPVGIAMVTTLDSDQGSGAQCSCGYTTYHRRKKIVDTKIEAHVDTKHEGRAMWL